MFLSKSTYEWNDICLFDKKNKLIWKYLVSDYYNK